MMKRYIIYLFVMLLTVSAVAQNDFRIYPEYGVGVRAGVNFSFVNFEPRVKQPSFLASFHAGLQFRMVSEKYFGIKMELNYTQRGFATTENNSTCYRRLDYIELPVMSHITFGNRLFRYFIDLGPSISYLLYDSPAANSTQQYHIKPIQNKFDYSIVVGTGFEFNTRYGIYTIDARYNFGLGNIFKSTAADYFKTSSNQNISVSLAYLFPIRGTAYDRKHKHEFNF